MKKNILLLFAALLPLVASAEKVEIDGIWYNLVSKVKQAEVTYKGNDPYQGGWYSGSITLSTTITYDGVQYSVTSIGSDAFSHCSSLTAITIPESVTSIGEYAFVGCSSLTDINIPESSQLTSIGEDAFFRCSSLTAITIPESVTSIGEWAFVGCSSLTAINIPEGVTSIGSYVFSGCSSLTTIVLPKNLKYIDYGAFANCSELLDVYCYAEEVPSTEADAFDSSYPKYVTLHVPANALNAYKSTEPWSNFGKIVPLTEEEAAISNTRANRIKVQGHHGTLRITGATEGEAISVYTTSGTLVAGETAQDDETELTLPEDQVYIVAVGDKVVKIGM